MPITPHFDHLNLIVVTNARFEVFIPRLPCPWPRKNISWRLPVLFAGPTQELSSTNPYGPGHQQCKFDRDVWRTVSMETNSIIQMIIDVVLVLLLAFRCSPPSKIWEMEDPSKCSGAFASGRGFGYFASSECCPLACTAANPRHPESCSMSSNLISNNTS